MTKLDAIIPVHVNDIERFEILQMSLLRYYPDIGNTFVVTPREHVPAFKAASRLPRCSVLADEDVVPEFDDHTVWPGWPGWWKQQVVKLAASKIVSSDYYFTFDADIICSKNITDADLFVNGKATMKRYSGNYDNQWYEWVVKVLGIAGPWKHRYSLTPTLLHREAVKSLAAYLEKKSGIECITYLCKSLPWTEYALYFTYLDHAGLFDTYYHNGEELYGNCVWFREQFEEWRPELSFGHYPFTIIQSNTEIPANDVMNKVRKYIMPNLILLA